MSAMFSLVRARNHPNKFRWILRAWLLHVGTTVASLFVKNNQVFHWTNNFFRWNYSKHFCSLKSSGPVHLGRKELQCIRTVSGWPTSRVLPNLKTQCISIQRSNVTCKTYQICNHLRIRMTCDEIHVLLLILHVEIVNSVMTEIPSLWNFLFTFSATSFHFPFVLSEYVSKFHVSSFQGPTYIKSPG